MAGCFWGHALVFHNEKGWASPVPMASWVQGDHSLHISPAKPAFEGCHAKQQVLTSSLGMYPASNSRAGSTLRPSSSSTRVLSLPCPGGDQCRCQLPFFRTGYRKVMVNGLREWVVLAGFVLKVLTGTRSPNRWSQPKSQISESPDMLKLRLIYMRPGQTLAPTQKC